MPRTGVLLTWSPHLVLDGAEVVAATVRRAAHDRGLRGRRPGAVGPGGRSGRGRRAAPGGAARMSRCVRPPARYVTGEESALVPGSSVGTPSRCCGSTSRCPCGCGRRPVLVHNAETLAQVALIARHGPGVVPRASGTPDAPGTTLVTVSAARCGRPGVVEVELGTPVGDMVGRCRSRPDRSAGLLVGGYGGAWLDPARASTPYAPGPLAGVGATLGVGIVVALPPTSCGIAETARIVRYMAGESAGQCGPCVFGLPGHRRRPRAAGGRPGRRRPCLDRIEHRCGAVMGRGACRHPDGVVRLVRCALAVFGDDARRPRRRPSVRRHVRPRSVLHVPAGWSCRTGGVVSRADGVALSLRVDPVACDAFGYCAELLPERVTLDEWGYPVVDGTADRPRPGRPGRPGRRRVPAAGAAPRTGSVAVHPDGVPARCAADPGDRGRIVAGRRGSAADGAGGGRPPPVR